VNVGVHWEEGGRAGSGGPTGLDIRASDRPRAHEGSTETEIAVFEASERLLAQEPLSELSVAQIIQEAGISRATFYFYFSSKYAVLAGLMARVSDEIFQVIQPFVQREESVQPKDALRDSLTASVDLWRRHGPAMRAMHEHWNTTDQLRTLWVGVVERFKEAIVSELDRQCEAGLAHPTCDTRLLSSLLLWSTAQCLYVAGLGVDPSLPDEEAALPGLLALWSSSIYGS
jgi:AcrR family transcriptional regulator